MPERSERRRARWQAPGRVNLIGEHTDYNQGFALPFALARECTATVAIAAGGRLVVRSDTRADPVDVALVDLRPRMRWPGGGEWAAYPAGVLWALRQRGHRLPGLVVELTSTVPSGSGLSSSAALVCSVAAAADEVLGLRLSAAELLAVSRSAENDFVGAPTGGMDQLAALRCTAGHALFCDMRDLSVEQVPFDPAAAGLAVLVVDSRARHRHSDGEYRQRRAGCERAARLLGVAALRDVAVADLDAALARLPEDELRRYTRHVVTENERVLQAVASLRAGNPAGIGALLTASHASLRDDYRITIPELDIAADTLVAAGALGARMTGGGFGGCVIALIAQAAVTDAVSAVRSQFARHAFAEPGCFTAAPCAGARRICA